MQQISWVAADLFTYPGVMWSMELELWALLVFVGSICGSPNGQFCIRFGLACRGVWETIAEGLLWAFFYVGSSRLERTLVSSSQWDADVWLRGV